MRALRKPCFVISFALVGSGMTAAFAETRSAITAPRSGNDRLANQNHRINRELKEGEITKQRLTSFIAKIARSGKRSARWRNSTVATSQRQSKTR